MLTDADKDHLHTRGEYAKDKYGKLLGKGSPPHTWRIQSEVIENAVADRITSTHVENTGCGLSGSLGCGDHLHTRGEYHFSF